jgi:hypothetical protein
MAEEPMGVGFSGTGPQMSGNVQREEGSRVMSEDDLRRIALAAADKEAAEFELDHADLNLKEAVVVALEHGTPPEVVAQVADLEPEEVIDLVHTLEAPALLTLDDLDPASALESAPTALPPIERDAV